MVSVIIPNYNYAAYLAERIESVLGQTYTDFEIILLDDCSSDGSREIIEKYRDNPKVSHIIYNETNSRSPFKQWRKGIELAKGEYVWIAESDDSADREFLATAVDMLDSDKSVVLFFSSANFIGSHGEKLDMDMDEWSMPLFSEENGSYKFDGKFYLSHYMVWNNCIYNASGAVFRKDAVKESFWKDCTRYRSCGDWNFWGHIISCGNVALSRRRLNYFRRHMSSTTALSVPDGRGMIECMKAIRSLRRNVPYIRYLVRIGTLHKDVRRGLNKNIEPKLFYRYYVKVFGLFDGGLALLAERINKLFEPVFPDKMIFADRDRKNRSGLL